MWRVSRRRITGKCQHADEASSRHELSDEWGKQVHARLKPVSWASHNDKEVPHCTALTRLTGMVTNVQWQRRSNPQVGCTITPHSLDTRRSHRRKDSSYLLGRPRARRFRRKERQRSPLPYLTEDASWGGCEDCDGWGQSETLCAGNKERQDPMSMSMSK